MFDSQLIQTSSIIQFEPVFCPNLGADFYGGPMQRLPFIVRRDKTQPVRRIDRISVEIRTSCSILVFWLDFCVDSGSVSLSSWGGWNF
jgi:hypothetical protein